MICDEAHTALGEKTSAAIRSLSEPIYVGMTATEELIAKQVSDVFPASVDDLPLADAARRGLIAPLRCLRVPPVAAINSVPIVGGDFEERALAAALDHEALNMAAATLYRERFDSTPGIVYAAGVDHAYNLATAFRAAGVKAEAVSGKTPPVKLATILASYERGEIDVLINAMLLAEGWNSPRATVVMHLAPTASQRVYQQRIGRIMRIHPRKEAGIVVDFTPKGATHNERVVSLHSLLDADFYREGARVTPAPRRRMQRRAQRKLTPAPWLVPVTPDVARRLAVIQREWQRVDPKYLDEDEQRFWATIAGRQMRFDERQAFVQKFTESGASKGALETFLATCAAQNPNRRLRMIALADRVSMRVERADFDDLVTLVTQAPPWEKDRAAGVRTLLRAIAEGKPDAPDQILARWTWRLARAVRKTLDRKASQEYQDGKRLLGALANSRGHRHEENAARLVTAALEMPREVGAALLASAEGYTPRVDAADRGRARAARHDPGDRRRARRRPARAEDGPVAHAPPPQAQAGRPARAEGDGPQATSRPRTAASSRRRSRRADGAAVAASRRAPRRRRRAAPGGARGRAPRPPNSARAPRNGRGAPRPSLTEDVRLRRPATLSRDRPARDRVPRRGRHRDLALRAARAADPARRRRDRPQAAPDRRRARRELRRLHALRRLAARQARPAAGLPAQPRDRAALPRRGDAARAAARALDRAAVRAAHALPRRAAAASCSAPRSGSSSSRAPGRCSRRSRSSPRTTTSAGARSCSRRLRARRGGADGADRVRRQGLAGAAARPRRAAARRLGRR